MVITTIGRGRIGSALAGQWELAGHTVNRLGRDGGDAGGSDVVLVAVPSGAVESALAGVGGLGGQVAIDATNAFDGRAPGHPSLAHQVSALVGGPTAKAFNLQHHLLYAHVREQRVRPSTLFAADDGARGTVAQLIADAGFDPVYVGGLEMARALEDAVQLFGAVRVQSGLPHFHRFAPPGELAPSTSR